MNIDQLEAARDPARPLSLVQLPRRFVESAWGGTETLVLECSRTLLKLGHRVEVFTTQALSNTHEECVRGVPVRRFAHFYPYLGLSRERRDQLELKGGNPFSLALLRALLAAPTLDLIHVHTGKRLGGIARHAARRRGIPYVVTLNGGAYDVPQAERDSLAAPSRGAFEWGKVLGWWVGSRRVLEDAAAIVCVGRREYELARERHPRQRVEYVPNGVDCERFASGDGASFRRRHGIAPDARVLISVGRIDPQKNQLQLVRLLPRWRAAIPGFHLVIVGPATGADYLARVHATARELGVADALTVVPGIEPGSRALEDAYHAADGFVLPSIHEPFGIVVLEAWAAGLPVVATRVGGLPGFIRHEQDALLVEPSDDDAMFEAGLRLLSDRDLAARIAARGSIRSRTEFSWTTCVERLLALYREVIDARSHRE